MCRVTSLYSYDQTDKSILDQFNYGTFLSPTEPYEATLAGNSWTMRSTSNIYSVFSLHPMALDANTSDISIVRYDVYNANQAIFSQIVCVYHFFPVELWNVGSVILIPVAKKKPLRLHCPKHSPSGANRFRNPKQKFKNFCIFTCAIVSFFFFLHLTTTILTCKAIDFLHQTKTSRE